MKNEQPVSDCQYAAQCCLGYHTRRAQRVLTTMYDQALEPAGIRSTQFTLMNAIELLHIPTINQLSEALIIDRTTLTRNLRLLENSGYIKIQPGRDRREKAITLTQEGKKTLKQALTLWKEIHHQVQELVGEERFERLLRDLNVVENLLSNK